MIPFNGLVENDNEDDDNDDDDDEGCIGNEEDDDDELNEEEALKRLVEASNDEARSLNTSDQCDKKQTSDKWADVLLVDDLVGLGQNDHNKRQKSNGELVDNGQTNGHKKLCQAGKVADNSGSLLSQVDNDENNFTPLVEHESLIGHHNLGQQNEQSMEADDQHQRFLQSQHFDQIAGDNCELVTTANCMVSSSSSTSSQVAATTIHYQSSPSTTFGHHHNNGSHHNHLHHHHHNHLSPASSQSNTGGSSLPPFCTL